MKWHNTLSLMVIIFTLGLFSCSQKKDEHQNEEIGHTQEDEIQVRESAQLYIDAINSRDLDQIVKLWSSQAIYRNPITGDLVQGRDGIRKELIKVFDRLQEGKLEFRIQSIRFPVEGKASEEGISVLSMPGSEPIHSDYKMIHVRENGKWFILHVSQLDFGMLDQNSQQQSLDPSSLQN
jgi:uncharacterized protein (TIGR02246 family)